MESWHVFLSILMLLVQLSVANCVISATNLTSDISALLGLKNHITDPHYFLTSNWSTEASVCNWFGVVCGSRHQRVIALNVSNMGLAGSIPADMANLSFLNSLDLSNNSFSGTLPQELSHLRRLKFINLNVNKFSGQFPSGFGMLHRLQHLLLTNNSFTGTLSPYISNASFLETLNVSYNFIQGQIPKEIGNLRRLKILDMTGNLLTGHLPFEIFNISSLQTIVLTSNNLSGTLPVDTCNHLPQLEVLCLVSNKLQGPIPQSLSRCSQLQQLDLFDNHFSGSVPKEIGNLTMLRTLILRSNNFTGHLPPTLGYGLPNLEGLYLHNNNFSGVIPDYISNSSKLTTVELSLNNFNGVIPRSIGDLIFLERLILADNNLESDSSSSELHFIDFLVNCKHLKWLSVGKNPLNGILPSSIGNLSLSLDTFFAAQSGIRGSIPIEIGNLSNLVSLFLHENELSGFLPETIKALSRLQQLYIGDNNLGGYIPYNLCKLQYLGGFFLEENNFEGPVPACIGNMTSLKYLNLSSNKLTSSIPASLWKLENMLELDLSSNFLSGHLEAEIGSLTAVIWIDLSCNNFSGDIPITLGGLQQLSSLQLDQNKFEGAIPQSFGQSLSLEVLDLSGNNLSGVLPESLQNLRYLKSFNVSHNRLRGEIPNEGPFKNLTYQSFMSNEAMCGAPRFRVPPCPSASSHKFTKRRIATVLSTLIVVASIIVVSIILWFLNRQRRKIPTNQDSLHETGLGRVSYYQLQEATDDFNELNFLGRGSCGSVYCGTFTNGIIYAVKVFNLELESALRTFDVECMVLRSLRHRNLTKVISCCSSPDFKALILEYMPNGSLEKWLYSHNYFLDIFQRLDIMIDVACALEYLHHSYSTPVVHCDLKPSNVLLDEDMVGRLTDFGIAKLLEGEATQTMTLGTIGYMAPEYGSEGLVSTSIDVYSFGILLMETFTRTRPGDEMFTGESTLKGWVKDTLPNSLSRIVDSNLLGSEEENFNTYLQSVSSIMKLALDCSAESPSERLSMKDVLVALKKIKRQLASRT